MWIGNMEITLKEFLASIAIFFVMLTIGFYLSEKIDSHLDSATQRYEQAMKISSNEIFDYAMRTSAGDAFVEGDLEMVDGVSMEAVKGKWIWLRREREEYTRHTRTITHHDGDKTWTEVEVYWTWDNIGIEDKHSEKYRFAGREFNWGAFSLHWLEYIDTVSDGYHLRSVYYGLGEGHGTIFGTLVDNGVKDGEYHEVGLNELVENKCAHQKSVIILFWFFWIILTGFIIMVLYQSESDLFA